jgi:hypothetical protein
MATLGSKIPLVRVSPALSTPPAGSPAPKASNTTTGSHPFNGTPEEEERLDLMNLAWVSDRAATMKAERAAKTKP